MSDLKSTMSNAPNEINSVRPDMPRTRLPPQHAPDPSYAPVAPQQQYQQQRSAPPAQFQPPPQPQPPPQTQPQPPPQTQPPPPQQQSHHAEVRTAAGGGGGGTAPARSPAPVRQPSQNIDTTILPSGKPVVKEVTITLSGKLPSHPTDAIPTAPDGKQRVLEEGTARQITTTTVTKQTIEHRESQQRVIDNRVPEKPLIPTQPQPTPPPKSRPTELPLQQERPTSRSSSRPQGTWCAKTGRFLADPPDPNARPAPPPEPVYTPTPRRPKTPGGSYCPRTGRYLPPQELARRAMTPKGDEFRVKFADEDDGSETPRYLRKERSSNKPNLVFGSVWTPREQSRPKVRRAKSTDWLEQRNAITPRGDGRDRDFAKSVENFNAREEQRPFSRSSSSRGSLRKPSHHENQGLPDFSNVTPRVSSFNDHYQPSGGHKKIVSAKLQWNVKSKIDSFTKRDDKKPNYAEQTGLDKKLHDYHQERATTEAQNAHSNANDDEPKKFPRTRVK